MTLHAGPTPLISNCLLCLLFSLPRLLCDNYLEKRLNSRHQVPKVQYEQYLTWKLDLIGSRWCSYNLPLYCYEANTSRRDRLLLMLRKLLFFIISCDVLSVNRGVRNAIIDMKKDLMYICYIVQTPFIILITFLK